MRRVITLSLVVGLAAAPAQYGCSTEETASGQHTPQPATSSPGPVYLAWPLPAADQAYGTIDGRHIWQYVKEQAEIAEHYRDHAKIVDQVNTLPLSDLQRPPEANPNAPGAPRAALDVTSCAGWVKDSASSCEPS